MADLDTEKLRNAKRKIGLIARRGHEVSQKRCADIAVEAWQLLDEAGVEDDENAGPTLDNSTTHE